MLILTVNEFGVRFTPHSLLVASYYFLQNEPLKGILPYVPKPYQEDRYGFQRSGPTGLGLSSPRIEARKALPPFPAVLYPPTMIMSLPPTNGHCEKRHNES